MHQPALFRQEVVEFQQQNRQWGRVVPLQPLPTRLMVWFVTAAAAAVIAFLFLAQYARKETVTGYLAPAAGTARVFAPQQGTVSAVHVEQGQRVEEGQPLLSVADGPDRGQRRGRQRHHPGHPRRGKGVAHPPDGRRGAARGVGAGPPHSPRSGASKPSWATSPRRSPSRRDRIRVVEKLVMSGAQLATRGLVSELDQRRREEALLEQRLNLSTLQPAG